MSQVSPVLHTEVTMRIGLKTYLETIVTNVKKHKIKLALDKHQFGETKSCFHYLCILCPAI